MIFLKKILIFFCILPHVFPLETFDPDLFPRPLIIEINEAQVNEWPIEEFQLQCTSWRVVVRANYLSPWKTILEKCADYVREYMTKRGYELDLQRVSNEAGLHERSVNLSGDRKIPWIFDVDVTLISNLPYYA